MSRGETSTMPVPGAAGSERVAGLPADTRARPNDPARDIPAARELVWAVSAAERHDWFPTDAQVATFWRAAPGFEPGRDALVVEDGQGMAAIVTVDRQLRSGQQIHQVEGWVRPDRWREGIATAILRWAERHAADLVARRATGHDELPQFIGFGTLDSVAGAIALAERLRYERVRYGLVMRRDLDESIPTAELPHGIELRQVRPADHRRIFDADVEAFLDHFEPRARTEDHFTDMFTAPNVDTSMWRVAWDGNEVVGSVMNQINPEENRQIGLDIGWLEHVSVRRAWRGRGVATALIAMSLDVLRRRGMAIAALGVDGENLTGALRLYEGLGFRRHETWITYRKPLIADQGRNEDA